MKILLIIIVLFSSFNAIAMVKKRSFSLNKQTKTSLVFLLDQAIQLHEVFYSKNEDQVLLKASKMIQHIKTIKPGLKRSLSYHQWLYIERLLQNVNSQLESLKIISDKTDRVGKIHSINRQVIYMAKVYGLKKYDVFFCSKDRSVWMQNIAKHKPLHLGYEFCGVSVSQAKKQKYQYSQRYSRIKPTSSQDSNKTSILD